MQTRLTGETRVVDKKKKKKGSNKRKPKTVQENSGLVGVGLDHEKS